MRKLGLRACGAEADIQRSVAVKNRYLAELSLLELYIENSSSCLYHVDHMLLESVRCICDDDSMASSLSC